MQYKGVRYYLESYLSDKYKDKALTMYDAIRDDFLFWPASIKYHHNYQGGLDRHTEEVIYYALKIFKTCEQDFRKKLVTESDIVFVGFIHDLEKLDKYVKNKNYDAKNFQPNVYEFKYNYDKIDTNDSARVVNLCAKYGIILSLRQLNALTFAHGGWSLDKGKMSVLATLIHAAELFSMSIYGNDD